MVLKCIKNYFQLVVFVVFLIFRVTIQNISPQLPRNRNDVNFYRTAYIDTAFCRTIPGLTKFQIELCKQQPDAAIVALKGLDRAVCECQNQFAGQRWNCSSLKTRGKNPYTTAMMHRGYKETAYAYAIASAGVAIAVARACSSSGLQNCGCDEATYTMRKPTQLLKPGGKYSSEPIQFLISSEKEWKRKEEYSDRGKLLQYVHDGFIKEINAGFWLDTKQVSNTPKSWKWKGCSHNLKYGLRFSKLFLDSREKADDIRSKTNLHNNQVGRMIVKHNMNVTCKCHGTTGSCSIMTCWRSTPDLRLIGHALKERLSKAVWVDHSMNSKRLRKFNTLIDSIRGNSKSKWKKQSDKTWQGRKSKKKRDSALDLLYYEKSPSFCDRIVDLGVPGTAGRICNNTVTAGSNSCDTLCCGRGYNSVKYSSLDRCNCRFLGCCQLKCEICNNTSWLNVCK